MKTIEEVRDWLLENRIDAFGFLDLSDLDFSDFDGDVYLGYMKVKKNLHRDSCEVGGNLTQGGNDVNGDFHSTHNRVSGEINQTEPTKLLIEVTIEELEKLGYKLKENK